MDTPTSESGHWKKRAALFLVSQNISLFGSSVTGFTIIWHITLATSSGVWIMLSTLCALLPQVLSSFLGGVWADRYNRKYLIVLSDSFIALATFGLAVAFLLDFRQLELLLAVSAVRSVGGGIQTPAVAAVYPQLVPQEHLTRVQGINQTLNSVMMLAAPAAGGLILSWTGIVAAFFVDVLTAAAAVLVMMNIPIKKTERQKASGPMWDNWKEGARYAFRHPQLRRLLICCLFSFFLITPAAVLSPLMVERTFGGGIWRLTANEVVWTVGSLFGGAFVSLKGEFKNKARTIALCLIAFGILFGLLGAAWNFTFFLAVMGAAGFFMPAMSTAQTVYIQEISEPEMLGRVFSILQIMSAGAVPAAILLFGPLADAVSVEVILQVSGLLLALVGARYGGR
ncbi:MAG: MFS transporter [Synergistaceae bacterium]|nr:MFS transporter [Synergistaceae bacterium]